MEEREMVLTTIRLYNLDTIDYEPSIWFCDAGASVNRGRGVCGARPTHYMFRRMKMLSLCEILCTVL